MGTTVTVLGPGGSPDAFEAAVGRIERRFAAEDRRFSRFRADSELTAVNEAAGSWTKVSGGFARVADLALEGARRTGGLFDPTVLPALAAWGYDRDFDSIRRRATVGEVRPPRCGRWAEIEVADDRLHLPEGVALDFGGIAKGWTVDRAIEDAGLPWVLIDAGGDLRLTGLEGGLDVAVDDPLRPGEEAARVHLEEGALATSSTTCRTWGPGLHHVIDPRTARPLAGEVIQATAWAVDCAHAEVRSTWALMTGPAALDTVPGLLVLTGDRIVTNLPSTTLEEAMA
jgi:thiamine biosynthesis lipoprotein